MDGSFDQLFVTLRPELEAYLRRLVVRPQVAEDLAQTAFVRLIESGPAVSDQADATRAWLFRVATNLAIDELRRHSTWRENALGDLRVAAESNPAFIARSQDLIGTPETKMVAREHLAACFSCTLRNLSERKAAALLLTEVHGFAIAEVADFLDATQAQAKNWLQDARAFMRARYEQTCALVSKAGVCHQCVELAGFFGSGEGDPIAGRGDHLKARLEVMKDLRSRPLGKWHSALFALLDELD